MLKPRTITIALIFIVLVGACGGLASWFRQARDGARSRSCLSNLKQISKSLALYCQDNDGHFPLVSGGSVVLRNNRRILGYKKSLGWTDDLHLYLHSDAVFQCPGEFSPQEFPASRKRYTDYWLNNNLSGTSQKSISFPAATFLLGEGNDGNDKTDATYSEIRLPASWLTDQGSPAFRHMGGANYLFVDGHVAWLKPDKVTSCYGRSDCFALK